MAIIIFMYVGSHDELPYSEILDGAHFRINGRP